MRVTLNIDTDKLPPYGVARVRIALKKLRN